MSRRSAAEAARVGIEIAAVNSASKLDAILFQLKLITSRMSELEKSHRVTASELKGRSKLINAVIRAKTSNQELRQENKQLHKLLEKEVADLQS